MKTLLDLLVGLSPLILLLSLPTFAAAVWLGAHGWSHGLSRRGVRLGFLVAGGVGGLMDAAAVACAALDRPHGRFMDCIDSGLLTGVPTMLVIGASVYTLVLMTGLAAWRLMEARPENA